MRTQILYLPRMPVKIKLISCTVMIMELYTFTRLRKKCSSSRLFISFAIFDGKVPRIDIIILCLAYSATLVNQNYNLLFTDYILYTYICEVDSIMQG